MRRVLLFLAVFSLGAGLIWLGTRGSRGAAVETPGEAVAPAVEPPAGPSTDPPVGPPGGPASTAGEGGGQDADPLFLRFKGLQSFDLYGASDGERRPRLYHLEGSFEPEDESFRRYVVVGLEVEQYDPASGELLNSVRAERARIRLEGTTRDDLAIAEDGRVLLEDVTIVRQREHELAPITIRAPLVEAWLDRQSFRSVGDEEVRLTARGIEGRGKGLVYEGLRGYLALEQGGEVSLDRGADGVATLSTPEGGALEIERVGLAGENRFEVRASDGARLVTEGPRATTIEARSIRVRGRIVAGDDGDEVLFERAVADGDVVAIRGPERYAAENAEVDVDEAGRIRRIVLENSPRARVLLRSAEGRETPIVATGAGPLVVDVTEEGEGFRLEGPARIAEEDGPLVVSARGSLAGTRDATGANFTVEARREVRAEQGERRVSTEALDALFVADELGTVRLVSQGPTRISGPDDGGQLMTVDVEGELDLNAVAERWEIPVARGVRVDAVGGPQPFRATAGLLRDFDWNERTFLAEEGVSWVGVFGEGDALTARLEPDGRAVLTGESGAPARFRVLPGRLDEDAAPDIESASFAALEIELRESGDAARIDARGEVTGAVDGVLEDYDLDADSAIFEVFAPDPDGRQPFSITAEVVRRVRLLGVDEQTTMTAGDLEVRGALEPVTEEGDGVVRTRLLPRAEVVVADGGVAVDHRGEVEVRIEGRTFRREGEQVTIEPEPDQPVTVRGRLPDSELPFELDAASFAWRGKKLSAVRPFLTLTAPLLSSTGGVVARPATVSADRLDLDETGLVLAGSAELVGTDPEGVPLRVRAGRMQLTGDLGNEDDPDRDGAIESFESFEASDGFVAVYGGLGIAHGGRIVLTRQRARIFGVEGRPATIEASGYALETRELDLDLETFLWSAGRGVLRALEAGGEGDLEFGAIEPRETELGTFFAVVSPRWLADRTEARCDFIAAWIDAEAWGARGRAALYGEEVPLADAPSTPPPKREGTATLLPDVFDRLSQGELPRYLKALHLQGALEVIEDGRTNARVDEVYLDLETRRGWLAGAELVARAEVGSGRETQIRVRSQRIRVREGGTLRANGATITTSKFDEPSYVIETDELSLEPVPGKGLFRLGASGNRVRFSNGLNLPLPSFGNVALDEEGGFEGFVGEEDEEVKTVDYIQAGQYARFGTTIGTAFRYDVGKLGRRIARFFGFDPDETRGKWYTEGAWLSDRGPLIGLGLEVREAGRNGTLNEDFWFNVYAKGIPDEGQDRGLVRVDEEDRDEFRSWIHGRARYPFSDREWLDVAYTTQSDPGVQAEFYQSDYQRYEERDSYVHWRRAEGDRYLDATMSTRVDEYRSVIEERPSAGAYRGEHEVARFAGVSLRHGWSLDLDNLRRREGDLRYEEPFVGSDGTPDGLGDREVLRANLEQRLSAPFALGEAGLRASPWLEGSATGWDRSLDPDSGATRAAVVGGVDLATTLVQRDGGGTLHTLTPTLSFRRDLVVDETGDEVVRFDGIDDPLEGQEVGAGVRALWWSARKGDHLDLAAKVFRQTARSQDLPDREVAQFLGDWLTHLGSMPFGVLHDGRFDLDTGRTLYARSTIAIQPTEPLILEFSYRRGVDAEQQGLFETASFDARWRFDPKWEFQLGQDISVKGGDTLKSDVIVRRFGADFLLELQVDHRAGEGGTSFGINFAPLFLWRRSPLGILER